MTHTFQAHSSAPNFIFRCGINGCIQSFRRFSAYSSHIKRKHHCYNPDFICGRPLSTDANYSDLDNDSSFNAEENFDNFHQTSLDQELEGSEIATQLEEGQYSEVSRSTLVRKTCATLILTIKEQHKLTQAAVTFLIGQIKELIKFMSSDMRSMVESIIQDHYMSSGLELPDLTSCFDMNPFDGLESQYLQMQFYRQHFNLVEPETVYLGSDSSGHRESFQYVPLLKGLAALVNNVEIRNELMQTHLRSDGFIGDFCDASLFKNHPLFQSCTSGFQIIAYYDEVETANCLGSHAGHNCKLGLLYYTLGNLRPELRSSHRAIQLIACVSYSVLAKYGFRQILEPFIKDINVLAKEGLSLTIDGTERKFYGTLLVMLADTVAAHDLGGFKSGVGWALRKCRHCMATGDDIQHKFTEDDFVLRTPASYDYHCSLLTGPMADADSTTYGISYNSPLNDIEYFHVANMMQMPQDVMHVLLEGVLSMEIQMMITFFIKNKYFSLTTLNDRLESFEFGAMNTKDKNPRPFRQKDFESTTNKLHLSAAQVWVFATFLPLIIGDKVPLSDPKWECFLLLLEIVKQCTARVTSRALAFYVKALVDQHHREFSHCYSGKRHTPKLHYMIHFTSQLLLTGPLVTTWCMRMEAKHSYFKKISQMGNYRNVCYSLAMRHQKLLCAHLEGQFFTFDLLECGPCNIPHVCTLSVDPMASEILAVIPDTDLEIPVSRPNWIKIYGNQYYKKQYVLCGWQDDDLPMFGQIKDVIVVMDCPLLVLEKFMTSGINNHLLSYLIVPTRSVFVKKVSSLPMRDPLSAHIYPGDGNFYIALKFNVPKNS